jgi:hypothetical protein
MHTDKWKAVDKSGNFAGGDRTLTVTGEVEVGSTGDTPSLKEVGSEGDTLTLEIHVQQGPGNDVMNWKKVEFVKQLDAESYSRVMIVDHEAIVAKIDVEKVLSVAGAPGS